MAGKDNSKKGFVYVLVHPRIPGLVKIGMTRAKVSETVDLEKRIKREISSPTGVPGKYMLYYAVQVDDFLKAEKLLLKAFAKNRIPSREFFEIDPSHAQAAMDLLTISGRVSKKLDQYIQKERKEIEHVRKIKEGKKMLEEESKKPLDSFPSGGQRKRLVSDRVRPKIERKNQSQKSKKEGRRPSIDMFQLGIKKGAKLTHASSSSIKATVESPNTVKYQGGIMKLTEAARKVKPRKEGVNGAREWEYKGETLDNRRTRMESISKKRVTPKPKGVNAQRSEGKKQKKPNTDMLRLGIPVGADLTFIKDNAIKAKVMGAYEVRFQGEVMKLSTAAKKALKKIGLEWKSCAGAYYWEHKGETLKKIRDRLESK